MSDEKDVNTRLTALELRLDAHLAECTASNGRMEKVLDGIQADMREYLKQANIARDTLHARVTSLSSEFKNALIWAMFTVLMGVVMGFGSVLWYLVQND